MGNKKSPRGIRPRRYSPFPQDAKYVTVTQDTSLRGKAEVCNEDLFGRAKTGGLGQVTTKKNDNEKKKKTGITRPRPDGGVKSAKINHRAKRPERRRFNLIGLSGEEDGAFPLPLVPTPPPCQSLLSFSPFVFFALAR